MMKPKFRKGQKVRIIEVKSQHGNMKYPEIEKYINEKGVIIESHWASIKNIDKEKYMPGDFYIYQVRLDNGSILNAVLEDAIVELK